MEQRRVVARSKALRLMTRARWRVIFCGLSWRAGRPSLKATFDAASLAGLRATAFVTRFLLMGCCPDFIFLKVIYTF